MKLKIKDLIDSGCVEGFPHRMLSNNFKSWIYMAEDIEQATVDLTKLLPVKECKICTGRGQIGYDIKGGRWIDTCKICNGLGYVFDLDEDKLAEVITLKCWWRRTAKEIAGIIITNLHKCRKD